MQIAPQTNPPVFVSDPDNARADKRMLAAVFGDMRNDLRSLVGTLISVGNVTGKPEAQHAAQVVQDVARKFDWATEEVTRRAQTEDVPSDLQSIVDAFMCQVSHWDSFHEDLEASLSKEEPDPRSEVARAIRSEIQSCADRVRLIADTWIEALANLRVLVERAKGPVRVEEKPAAPAESSSGN